MRILSQRLSNSEPSPTPTSRSAMPLSPLRQNSFGHSQSVPFDLKVQTFSADSIGIWFNCYEENLGVSVKLPVRFEQRAIIGSLRSGFSLGVKLKVYLNPVMEESEKRRERLRAMRAEAAQADSSVNELTPAMPGSNLSNPLSETHAQEEPHSAPRFDFYTDPMSAFSGNPRRDGPSDRGYAGHFTPPINSSSPVSRFPPPPPGSRNPEASPRAHHFHGNYSPNQQIYQGRGFGHTPFPQRGPVGMFRPPNMHQVNTDPSFAPGVAVGYNYNSQYQGPRNPSPRFSPAGRHHPSQGMSQWVNNSPNSGSGYRGRDHFHGSGSSPNPGRRGGRGGHFSTANRTSGGERFYNDSMIEDPWKFLEPVMWKEVEIPKPWNPRPIGTKKAKVSDDINKPGPQPTLAEYLATSFDEAAGEEDTS